MSDQEILVNSQLSCERAVAEIRRLFAEHGYVKLKWTRGQQRTDQQRKSIELYCRMLADALNDVGLDQRAVLARMRDGVELPWAQQRVKDTLWREVQIALTGKESSTKLTRSEVSQVYEVLNRWTAGTLGVSVPFPDRERLTA